MNMNKNAGLSPSQRPVIVASNRGPVSLTHDEQDNQVIQRGSGGLVTALTGMARYIDMTWIACAQTPEDRAWESGNIDIGNGASIQIQFLAPSEEAYQGYYNMIANPLLWFLQHSMWDIARAPVINRDTWQAWEEGYVTVNQLFANQIVQQVRKNHRSSLIMLQDYHLYLAPRLIRNKRFLKNTSLMHFIHIPWPGPEYWSMLPPGMRRTILDGLCGLDLLGFQTREDGLNFLRTCESFLPTANVNYRRGRVWYRSRSTYVRDFPISIDVEALKNMAESVEVRNYQSELKEIIQNQKVILRIDRIEPSKNIIRGFQAFEELLGLHPEHQGQVVFLALLTPSRLDVEEYQSYLSELMAAVGHINARYGSSDWEPVRLLISENYPRAIAALQEYDVLLVNSIADGMNLVAKEGPIVNQKDGVLVLSERAGAQQQLAPGATIISPCDIYATAEALHQALNMPMEERQERAYRLRWLIEKEDINAWLTHQLEALSELNL